MLELGIRGPEGKPLVHRRISPAPVVYGRRSSCIAWGWFGSAFAKDHQAIEAPGVGGLGMLVL